MLWRNPGTTKKRQPISDARWRRLMRRTCHVLALAAGASLLVVSALHVSWWAAAAGFAAVRWVWRVNL